MGSPARLFASGGLGIIECVQKSVSKIDERTRRKGYAVNSAKKIERLLTQALLRNGAMDYGLYEYELQEQTSRMRQSLIQDRDDYIFAVTENAGYVAMFLLEASGAEYINEQARERLKKLWPSPAYENNLKKLIPPIARDLGRGELPFNGIKIVR